MKVEITKCKNQTENINLTEEDILKTVKYWYLNLTPDIFQNENGSDLEEYIDTKLTIINIINK